MEVLERDEHIFPLGLADPLASQTPFWIMSHTELTRASPEFVTDTGTLRKHLASGCTPNSPATAPSLCFTERSCCDTGLAASFGPANLLSPILLCSPGSQEPPLLSLSDLYRCQPCGKEEWAPEGSQTCFPRTVVVLTWQEPISWVLLAANTLLLLLLVGTAGLFARHLDTPVVRSAGGRLCFLMLGSLAAGSCSLYGFFGEPTLPTCLLRQALFPLGFAIFLSCLTVRSFQLVIIFKFSTKVPRFYRAWVQNHGAGLFVMISSMAQLLICLTWLVVWTPLPTREYQRFPQLVVLECTESNSLGFLLAFTYNVLLSVSAFACSYLGKDLPENYNEAKCVTFSQLLNFVSWITFFTVASVYEGKYLPVVNVLALLTCLSSGFSGYFLPKCYVILCRSDLNNTGHFQASIQDYTRRCSPT